MPRNNRLVFCGWRVEDDNSRASYWNGDGISAESDCWVSFNPRNQYERKRLLREVKLHLDWRNRRPTPFISVYTNYHHAKSEAQRRAQTTTNVVIYHLKISAQDIEEYGPIHFRKVTKLMEGVLGSQVPEYVGRNAEDEIVFLHHIPDEVIVEMDHGNEGFWRDWA